MLVDFHPARAIRQSFGPFMQYRHRPVPSPFPFLSLGQAGDNQRFGARQVKYRGVAQQPAFWREHKVAWRTGGDFPMTAIEVHPTQSEQAKGWEAAAGARMALGGKKPVRPQGEPVRIGRAAGQHHMAAKAWKILFFLRRHGHAIDMHAVALPAVRQRLAAPCVHAQPNRQNPKPTSSHPANQSRTPYAYKQKLFE